ncbi:DUF2332 family protein [Microbacterium sp. ZW T5_56]|uniref:DUF2332 family protein n=1 Tax=Microbacterium sp. ZW T5_56 TaxID=3378081 RepID=UPI0038541BC4
MTVSDVQERYARFAREEAPGRSEVYERWARAVAHDSALAAVIAALPEQRRQPPLVFALARTLGAGAGTDELAAVLRTKSAQVRELAERRSVQTNEPLRCAALLPALARIEGPIALLELGAAAGLCLYPDRYGYRFITREGTTTAGDNSSAVILTSQWRSDLPVPQRLPMIDWRAGVDRDPLNAQDPDDRAWLTALVWPGETGRTERIDAALDVAAAEPPLLHAFDLAETGAEAIAALLAEVPSGLTPVISTPGILPFLPKAARAELIDAIRASGARWITMDAPGLHAGWTTPVSGVEDGFALALDGRVIAAVDPLGRWVRMLD